MNNVLKILGMITCLPALNGCVQIPPEAYANRGDPERLLVVSSDLVTIDLTSGDALKNLTDAVTDNPPAQATLNCPPDENFCQKAKAILTAHRIATEATGEGDNVTLMYKHIDARDCENRYIDNSSNPYNLEPPTFGCSVTGNMVQMVTDKKQFTNPGLLDFRDGEKTSQVYDNYLAPPVAPTPASGGGNSGVGSLIPASSSQ